MPSMIVAWVVRVSEMGVCGASIDKELLKLTQVFFIGMHLLYLHFKMKNI
jgi:hypothetical protein